MKNYRIFAASSPKTNINVSCSSYFYGYTDAAYQKDIRLSIHNGLLRKRCNLSLARCGKVAFLLLITFIFHFMPKTMEDASKVKYSNHTSTLTERNTVSIEAFNIEKNAKNEAYYFILSHGLLKQFSEFSKNYQSDNPHLDCLNFLSSKI